MVQNTYIYQIVNDNGNYTQKLLKTYENIGGDWDWTPDTLAKFPWGQMRNKWVGMTKDKLDALTQ